MSLRATRCIGVLMVVLGVCCVASAQGSGGARDKALEVFERANGLFVEAESVLSDDPTAARELFAQSAALYGSLVTEHGIASAGLHTNRGSALLLSGDAPRAIASYLRALRVEPMHEGARAGLAEARRAAPSPITANASRRVSEVVLAWRGVVPRWVVIGVGVVSWWLVFVLVSAALARGDRVPRVGVAACLLVVVGSATALGVEHAEYALTTHAVVVEEASARLGPGVNAYEEAFSAPLPAGTEVVVLERRREWSRVRLADGRSAWVATNSLESV